MIRTDKCNICPRLCNANRNSEKLGYCNTNLNFSISTICRHLGEEPLISGSSGICNIFFTGCNLKCIYCQNYQISRAKSSPNFELSFNEVIAQILELLESGCHSVGFVSPSHVIPQVKAIIEHLKKIGIKTTFVYNTNAYDKLSTIRELDGLIDVYLPDFKYMNSKIAKEFSDAVNYPEIATAAIKEMYRQVGSKIEIHNEGYAKRGLIIRHLVLPGNVQNSLSVLRYITNEISNDIHISLMSQYHPIPEVKNHPALSRKLRFDEYEIVTQELEELGFENGWVQELESSTHFLPDFENERPFGE